MFWNENISQDQQLLIGNLKNNAPRKLIAVISRDIPYTKRK